VSSHLEVLDLIEGPEEDGSISKEHSQWVTALRLSSHGSWLLPQLTFLCANISLAVLRGRPLSAEDFPDMALASCSNRRLSLTGASRMIRSATRGSMLERRETLVLPSEYESRRRGFPGFCCAVCSGEGPLLPVLQLVGRDGLVIV